MKRIALVCAIGCASCLHDWERVTLHASADAAAAMDAYDVLARDRADVDAVDTPASDAYDVLAERAADAPEQLLDVVDAVDAVDVPELPDVVDVVDVHAVDVPDVVDVHTIAPGSPGAACTLPTDCTRGGADCCLPSHVCACLQFGSCAPTFCP